MRAPAPRRALSPLVLAALAFGLVLGAELRSARAQDAPPPPDPWGLERMEPEQRLELERVRAGATVATALEPRRVQASARVYGTLLTELPLASRWLEALELGVYQIEDVPERPNTFRIDDKAGARAEGLRVLTESTRLVVLAPGTLQVPLLPKIEGTGAILIQFPPAPPRAGEAPALLCSAEVAFRVEGRALHALGRALRGVLERVLRRKLEDLVRAATGLAEAITASPTQVYARLSAAGISAEDLAAFRERFLAL